jgi:hypothetical protein
VQDPTFPRDLPGTPHPSLYDAVRQDDPGSAEAAVVLINPFEVPDGEDDEYLASWDRARDASDPPPRAPGALRGHHQLAHRARVLRRPRGRADGRATELPEAPKQTFSRLHERNSRTTKPGGSGAFERYAEEDSNLHSVSPDQALNLVTRGVRCVQIVRPRPKRARSGRRTRWTIWMFAADVATTFLRWRDTA